MVIHRYVLSGRQKVLSAVALALLILLIAVGYTKTAGQGLASTLAAEGEDVSNQQSQLKGQKDYLQNLRREIQDISKVAKTVNLSVINGHLTEFESCLAAREAELGTPDFWDNLSGCNDHSRSIEDELNANLRPNRKCADSKRNFEDRKREKKNNIEKQTKEILRSDKNADVSALNQIAGQIAALFARAEQYASGTCTSDTSAEFEDLNSEIGSLFQDWYSLFNEANDKANETRRLNDNMKDFEKNIKQQCQKNKAREFKNFEKEYLKLKAKGTLSADAEEGFNKTKELYEDQCVKLFGQMEQALRAQDFDEFESVRNDFFASDRDFWDTMNDARGVLDQQKQAKDVLRDLAQREKELDRMKKEYARAAKKSAAGSQDITRILDEYAEIISRAKEETVSDPQSYWSDHQQTLNELQNEFWNSNQKVHAAGDVSRWAKDIERDLTFREKDLKRLKKECREVGGQLEAILTQMKDLLAQAKEKAADDPDSARDSLQEMDDLRMQWDDTSRSCWEGKQTEMELGKALNEVEHVEDAVNNMVDSGEVESDQAQTCLAFIGNTKGRIREAMQQPFENMEDWFNSLEEEGLTVCPFLEGKDLGEAPVDRDYYKQFARQNVKEIDQDKIAYVFDRVGQDVIEKIMSQLLQDPTVIENLLRAAGEKNKAAAAGTIEAISSYYDENAQRDLFAKKAEILELTQQLENVQSRLQAASDKLRELQTLQEEIANYNFYGNGNDAIRNEIEEFVAKANNSNLNREEIRAGIEKLKAKKESAIQESKLAKYEAKIIPFMDTDDNSWYTKYVAPLAKLGIVQGKGEGRFDPAAQVTVAEVLTMAFRISGDGESEERSSLCTGRYGTHWADKFISWAESRGLSIVSSCTDIDRPAKRWEVAQVLLETASSQGDIEFSDEKCFSDVGASDQPVNSVLCQAKKASLLAGVDGKSNAYANVIRAEAATMVKQAAEKLFGVTFEDNSGQSEEAQQSESQQFSDFENFEDEEDEENVE